MIGITVLIYLGLALSLSESESLEFQKDTRELISNYTDMTLIDSKVFDDQIHLLVNKITHQAKDEFNYRMANLTKSGLIIMVAANSPDTVWPPQRVPMRLYVPGDSEPFNEKRSSQLDTFKRNEPDMTKIKGLRKILAHTDPLCKDKHEAHDYLTSGTCFWVWRDEIQAYFITNPGDSVMEMTLYQSRPCHTGRIIAHLWQQGHSDICHPMKTNNALWWEWPGYPAP